VQVPPWRLDLQRLLDSVHLAADMPQAGVPPGITSVPKPFQLQVSQRLPVHVGDRAALCTLGCARCVHGQVNRLDVAACLGPSPALLSRHATCGRRSRRHAWAGAWARPGPCVVPGITPSALVPNQRTD
jgi:hypothetical protein